MGARPRIPLTSIDDSQWEDSHESSHIFFLMMSDLARKECIPCRGDTPPLSADQVSKLLVQIDLSWSAVENHHLEREFRFENFRDALKFTNQVGEIAESQGHHPDIHLAWGRVNLQMWTHKIDGLTESDFILAAKIDQLS